MAWIESHQALARHPKLIRFASSLKISKPAAIGHLHLLWWWSLDYAQDGSLAEYDDKTIADAAEWKKSAAVFVAAMCDSGWIDPDRSLHDWMEYAGKLIEKRRSDADRKRAARTSSVRGADVGRTSDGRRSDGAGTNQPTNQQTEPTVPTKDFDSPDSKAALEIYPPNGEQPFEFELSEAWTIALGGADSKAAQVWRGIARRQPAFGQVSPDVLHRYRLDLGGERFYEMLAGLSLSLPDPPPVNKLAAGAYLAKIAKRVKAEASA